jgi:hypothetical protein
VLISADDLVAVEPDRVPLIGDPSGNIRATVGIQVGDRPCAVHFDDVDVAARFCSRYTDLTTDARCYAVESFAMTDPDFGPVFWTPGGRAFRWPFGPLDAYVHAFLADAVALTAFFSLRGEGLVSLHAATVGVSGAAAAIIGNSNDGKTTTAIAALRAGLRLYGDERCVIDRNGLVYPFPRALNVRAPGRRLLIADRIGGPDPVGDALRERADGDWADVRFGELLPAWTCPPPEPLRAVFLLEGSAGEPCLTATTPAHAAKAAARWAQGAGNGLDKIARLVELFGAASCYRLVLGSPHASARAIEATLLQLTTYQRQTA